jgi:hypothetical protein
MGFVSIIAAFCIALLWATIFIWQKKRQITQAKAYRLKYVQLLALLEQTTDRLNSLSRSSSLIGDDRLVTFYESTIKIFETLLEAIRHLPAFSAELAQIKSAWILAEDCSERVSKIEVAFKSHLEGASLPDTFFDILPKNGKLASKIGCYFCSRPFVQNRFSMVRVRVETEVKHVAACHICKEELETTKKIKVLYFMKNGKPVHWSEVEDYTPIEDFWDINKRNPLRKERRLELVPKMEHASVNSEREDEN